MRADAVAGTATGARATLAQLADELVEHDADLISTDPLDWPGYDAQLTRARERSGELESVVSAEGRVGATRAVLVAFDFAFMGGSMSEAGGLKIANAFRRAAAAGLPVVSLHSSGGCRMQEGMKALVQMQRIAAANQVLAAAGVPHVAILMGPTTGGAWASIAAGADVILAVPEATAAFAGHRVREGGAKATIQDTVESGQVDLVVPREELALTLATLLGLLVPDRDELPPADVPTALGESDLPSDGWDAVQRARAPRRSRAEAYLDAYFDVRVPLGGDRAGGHDPGMLCGFGRRAGGADRLRGADRRRQHAGRVPDRGAHRAPGRPARHPGPHAHRHARRRERRGRRGRGHRPLHRRRVRRRRRRPGARSRAS